MLKFEFEFARWSKQTAESFKHLRHNLQSCAEKYIHCDCIFSFNPTEDFA